jgi:hypothetical protein
VQAGDDINAPVNTGTNTGIIADGDVYDAVVGDNNQTVQADGSVDDSVFNFGGGDVQQINDSIVEDVALTMDGDASNVSDNIAQDGGAIATGAGDATGTYDDADQTTTVTGDDGVQVAVEQGEGNQDADQTGPSEDIDANVDVDFATDPTVLQ